jgi:hypothetical protein
MNIPQNTLYWPFSSSEESNPRKTQGLRFSFFFVVVLLDATAARWLFVVVFLI